METITKDNRPSFTVPKEAVPDILEEIDRILKRVYHEEQQEDTE